VFNLRGLVLGPMRLGGELPAGTAGRLLLVVPTGMEGRGREARGTLLSLLRSVAGSYRGGGVPRVSTHDIDKSSSIGTDCCVKDVGGRLGTGGISGCSLLLPLKNAADNGVRGVRGVRNPCGVSGMGPYSCSMLQVAEADTSSADLADAGLGENAVLTDSGVNVVLPPDLMRLRDGAGVTGDGKDTGESAERSTLPGVKRTDSRLKSI